MPFFEAMVSLQTYGELRVQVNLSGKIVLHNHNLFSESRLTFSVRASHLASWRLGLLCLSRSRPNYPAR